MIGRKDDDGVVRKTGFLKHRGQGSRPFDAEGIASIPQPIVQDGVLQRWVLDLASARKLGLQTTGNARRGVGGPPGPGATNISLTQGAKSREDLIRDRLDDWSACQDCGIWQSHVTDVRDEDGFKVTRNMITEIVQPR